ncbi:phosphatase PAP2 family protein [Streptomyces sp. XM4011]|uniref:phosphatase PAP2 family protein n=1 Tax=Streptomyces sp. XM4011 TaxID=2929780 RepID=UPI001FFB9E03|nr:phosphatase PAP2 family protein [Streptomyces sp. XM4011]MCK1814454.1 phosphatase PAP2 family protein [Streptomyces sp. XM4011]
MTVHHTPTTTSPARPARGRRPGAGALYLLGFAALYLVAVRTPFGQRAENGLINENGAGPAWIYDWSGAAYGSWALPPLEDTALPALLAGLAVLAAVTVVRRCWWRGGAAAGVVTGTLVTAEVCARVLPRPDLVDAPMMLLEPSFPSGHAAVPAALAAGAALVVSARVRPWVLAAGLLWLAVTAAAVQATYHHRPSDVLGAALLACVCHRLAVRLLPADAAQGAPAPSRWPAVAALVPAAAGALVAGARNDGLLPSLVFAAAAFGCALLLWSAVRLDRSAR